MHIHHIAPCLLAALACGAWGHDLRGAATQGMSSASGQLAQALSEAGADQATKSVLSNLRLWPVPRRLTICFTGGSAELRARVLAVMKARWPIGKLSNGRLDFDPASFGLAGDCAPTPAADIRVAFKDGDGHWSYVGVESLQHNPSMNFDGIEAKTEQEFQRIVSHELGHALGLEHEHQSPAIPKDCGWNYDYLWTHYNWSSKEDMRDNLDKLKDTLQKDQRTYRFSVYDRRSNMHYFFQPAAFTAGKDSPCYIRAENDVPSDLDLASMRLAYGNNALTQQAATKGAAPALLQRYTKALYPQLYRIIELKSSMIGN